ncbi:SDR family oxidoreductase [Pectobacterium polonicum]|uniref:SDR family oxidoreductase n=1 Tax=Pectobacterium polonicum TaxID=2485124 RepID=A0AAE9NR34_9GAMM|nr:SDR family oxidoreductase [Pectobacterium polonicum]UVO06856.1 SDR family oxidoreductase [Pectobacterium polonicum]GKW24086.1 3-oxoacyl-[acyl-carrier-protein] reductase FabG [Pectobacterium carotovorum subsp. carotovorum]
MLLVGKNAVITGCLQGIGRATLETFAREGANVFACCQAENAAFNEYLIDLSEKYRVDIIPVYFDFLDENEIKKGVAVIQKSKKPIDVLVNVAGITLDAFFHMITMEQMKKTFAVNFFSQMFFTQYITKLMLRQRKGSVINVSSISALDGNSGQLSYSASKAALIAATKTLSAELAPQGIRVNAVAPGVIQTAMTANLPQEALDRQMARCELKRLGLPEEVAKAILYLASDASSYITGQVVRIDGGMG